MTTVGIIFKIFGFLFRNRKQEKLAFKLNKAGDIAARDEVVTAVVSKWGRYVVECAQDKTGSVTVEGTENIPKDGSVVFIANHQGYMDITLLLGYSGKKMGFIAKKELLKIPVISRWMKLMQCTFLDRKNPKQSIKAMAQAVETVKKGYSLVIFPEGHRSKGGPIQEFKPGSFKLAYRAGVPIVPVTIINSWKLYEEHKKPRPADVKLIFHKPIETAGLSREQQALIAPEVQKIVESRLDK